MLHKLIINALKELGYTTEPLYDDYDIPGHIFIWTGNTLENRKNIGHITLNDYPQALYLYKNNTGHTKNYQEISQADPELITKIQEFYGPAKQPINTNSD